MIEEVINTTEWGSNGEEVENAREEGNKRQNKRITSNRVMRKE